MDASQTAGVLPIQVEEQGIDVSFVLQGIKGFLDHREREEFMSVKDLNFAS